MATRVDLHIDAVKDALKTKLQSANRAINGAANPMVKELLQKDAAALQQALNTVSEVK